MKNTMKFKPYALFLCALLALTGCQAADTGAQPGVYGFRNHFFPGNSRRHHGDRHGDHHNNHQ